MCVCVLSSADSFVVSLLFSVAILDMYIKFMEFRPFHKYIYLIYIYLLLLYDSSILDIEHSLYYIVLGLAQTHKVI